MNIFSQVYLVHDDDLIKFESVRGKVTLNAGQIGTISLFLFISGGLILTYVFIVLGTVTWILVIVWKNSSQREIDRILAKGKDPIA